MKVTVSIITFQHAETVREALESVLQQATDFPFEVVVGDDASTDGTQRILSEIAARMPDRVRLILRDRNGGDRGLTNLRSTIEAARGDYIAFLDGDDVWTDTGKLRKQVDFLDAHPECAICAHRVEHLKAGDVRVLSPAPPRKGTSLQDVGDLIVQNFAPRISTMIRRSALDTVPEWYWTSTIISADWLLNVLVARNGGVGFLDEVMATHRLHAGSMTLRSGAVRMLTDKLEVLPRLEPLMPRSSASLARAERRLRWKLRLLRLSPGLFAMLKRLRGAFVARPPRTLASSTDDRPRR